MSSVKKQPNGRWQVRYRDPLNRQRARNFRRKTDADRFASAVETDVIRGEWIDPRLGRVTFGEWADEWLDQLSHVKPKTRLGYESSLRKNALPRLAGTRLADLDRVALRHFVADLERSGAKPDTIRIAMHVTRAVLDLAVDAGALRANPALGVKVPRRIKSDKLFLTPDQIEQLASVMDEPDATLVRFAAYTGLRAGEIGALTVGRVDFDRSVVEVAESLADVAGHLEVGPTKTYARRHIPMPGPIAADLERLIRSRACGRSDRVFTAPQGGMLRHGNFYRNKFKPAVIRSGLPDELRFHDLRHTYAALCIASTADPYAVMKRMGHSSITVTYDTYGHLFPARDAEITDNLDALAIQARADRA